MRDLIHGQIKTLSTGEQVELHPHHICTNTQSKKIREKCRTLFKN